jgi:diacylglycerol kinase family enzyme/phosphatidylglycerophosphate synthase
MKLTNLTALFHIVILPFIVYLLSQDTQITSIIAFSLLLISIFIDFLQRMIIKKSYVRSFLHPFSDKIVILVLLLFFATQDFFSSTILIIFVVRDLIVGFIRMRASRDYVEISVAKFYGKVLTSCQFAIVLGLLGKNVYNFYLLNFSLISLTILALILAIASIFHYSIVYREALKTRKQLGKKLEREKMIILANRKSGGYRHTYRRRLLRRFAKRRRAAISYLPHSKDMFHQIKNKIMEADQVIIAGGDGSFESALNNKHLQQKSLGFFPLGAGNAYYSYFYKGKRFEYLRSRFNFHEVELDIIELTWEKGKIETTFLSIGADAEVIHQSRNLTHHNFADYFKASFKVIMGPRISYNLQCTVDNQTYSWQNCFNLIIGKVPFIGFGLRSLMGRMGNDDGNILGMAFINPHSAFFNKMLRVYSLVLTQLGFDRAPLFPLRGKSYHISSKLDFPLQAGGEFLGYTKWVKVKVIRKQKVLMIEK